MAYARTQAFFCIISVSVEHNKHEILDEEKWREEKFQGREEDVFNYQGGGHMLPSVIFAVENDVKEFKIDNV